MAGPCVLNDTSDLEELSKQQVWVSFLTVLFFPLFSCYNQHHEVMPFTTVSLSVGIVPEANCTVKHKRAAASFDWTWENNFQLGSDGENERHGKTGFLHHDQGRQKHHGFCSFRSGSRGMFFLLFLNRCLTFLLFFFFLFLFFFFFFFFLSFCIPVSSPPSSSSSSAAF